MNGTRRRATLAPLTAQHSAAGLLSRFDQVATCLTHETAVTDDAGGWTFAEVAERAAGVRRSVVDRVPAGRPVAVLFPHRKEAVAAILGVLASGRPLLVLDYRTPTPRLRGSCEQVGAAAVVVAEDLLPSAADLGVAVLGPRDITSAPRESLWEGSRTAVPTILAFTSGSTGTPKVVVNEEQMLVADAWRNSAATGCYDADDVIAHTLPMAFHAGLMVTIAGLLVGSTMRLFDTREKGITALPPWIESVGATVMHTSPAILRAFVGAGPTPGQLSSLRTVTIAGEPAHARDVELLRPLVPPTCVLRNRYGSSETGLIAEYRVAPDAPPLSGPLPVGAQVGDTDITLLSEEGAPVPPGEPGVVVVTRDHVASGYLDAQEATERAFRTEPDGRRTYRSNDVGVLHDGTLSLVGRRDHSVKIRGYLVEPGDVDAALFALPDVAEALTVGVKDSAGERYRLVSYVVSRAERPAASVLRSALRERLPGHLVPEAVVFLDALPRTERGKLDRSALPAAPPPDLGAPPETEWENLVAQVWASVLGLESVGRDADFFALGGDSLAAEEVTARVVTDLGIDASDVTSSMLAQAPTVAQYARRLQRRPDRREQILTRLATGADGTPLFLVAGGGGLGVGFVPLVRHLPADLPVYALHSYGLELKALPDWSIPAAARRNLRMVKRLQPYGPYRLGGHSFGGLVALEMAHQLRRAGDEVSLLMVLDSFPPNPDVIPPRPYDRTGLGRLRDWAGLLVTGLIPNPGHGQYWRFHAQSHVLSMRYRTEPYPGRTLVVVAKGEDEVARELWEPHLSGQWTRVRTPGGHQSMLRDPNAEVLAQHMTRALEESEAAPSSFGRAAGTTGTVLGTTEP